jgi:hypothetical protein
MMLNKLFPWPALILVCVTLACSSKRDAQSEGDSTTASNDEWKEMDVFHMVMAEAFHPFKDSANLEPAKNNADSLLSAADKWAQAPLPDKFEEDDEIKFKLNQLRTDASTFISVVQSGDDKTIGQSLTKLHDLFHEIQESWYEEHE